MAAMFMFMFPNDMIIASGKKPDWYVGDDDMWRIHEGLLSKSPPPIDVAHWRNGRVTGAQTKGRIIVLDFWATWCGPCLRSIPHNNRLYESYRDEGVLLIGICGSDRQDRMPRVVEDHGIRYPVARDHQRRTASSWRVRWWPTYAIIDRDGVVKAFGIRPDRIEAFLDELLIEQPWEEPAATEADVDSRDAATVTEEGSQVEGDADTSRAIPDIWLEGDAEERGRLMVLSERGELPQLKISRWLSGEPATLAGLKGSWVLVDFWSTWSGQSVSQFPVLQSLHEAYHDKGLEIVSICHELEWEKAVAMIESHGIGYRVGVDDQMQSGGDFAVDGYPDYYLIDRDGRIKFADIRNHCLKDAVEWVMVNEAMINEAMVNEANER